MYDRFIKTLIVVNGLLLPILIGLLLFEYIKDKFFDDKNEYYESESIIVGDELQQAINDSVALQGIIYSEPEEIYNSTNKYIPISVLTYKEAKSLKHTIESAGNFSLSRYNCYNILFIDKEYNVIGKLLNKKGFISDIHVVSKYHNKDEEIDKTVKNIAYLIGFEDTNNDKKLNDMDFMDLYISDLSGKNLTQVSHNISVIDFHFIDDHESIFISYKDRNSQREEYNLTKFAIYNISDSSFTMLNEIDLAIQGIENSLIE